MWWFVFSIALIGLIGTPIIVLVYLYRKNKRKEE